MQIRKIDRLGRIVIPKEFCKQQGFAQKQEIEITIEYGKLCIKKFEESDINERAYIGIVRCLDSVNRLDVPKEYRNVLNILPNTEMLFSIENDKIVIVKANQK